MSFISYLIFFLEVFIFNLLNYRIYKTYLNPMAFLSIPFTIILISCLILNSYLGFIPFHYKGLWIWIIGLFFFGISGLIMSLPKVSKKEILKVNNKSLVWNIILVSILYMVLQFKQLQNYDLGSKELGEEIAVGGLTGRVSNLLLAMCPFMVCAKYNIICKIIIIPLIIYFIIATGSKTWILYAFMASMLCIYKQHKTKFNILFILLLIIGMFLFFGLYYKLNTEIQDINDLSGFIIRHFYFYLTSGILPLSEFVRTEAPNLGEHFVLPFFNIIKVWLGYDGIEGHSANFFITDLVLGTQSNVFTFFGSLYMGNYVSLCVYSIIFGVVSYMIFITALRYNNIFLYAANAYNSCILFFGWYNCGYGLLRIWEILIILILFYALSKRKINLLKYH